jgi:uncharacterized protein YciI
LAYYAANLHMLDAKKNDEIRPLHIEYLDKLDGEGKIFARGPYKDGTGGLVVYIAETFEEAWDIAANDPHVLENTRRLELKEWQLIRAFSERN